MGTVEWLGMPLKVSNSELQTFKSCRRRWYLTYYRELGIQRGTGRVVGARELGTRVHVALHALYTDGSDALTVIDQVYQEDINELTAREGYTEDLLISLRKEHTLARAMIEGFLIWRAAEGIDADMELIAPETVLETPFTPVPGVILRGKLDQRWHRKRDGARIFRDWKTAADLTTPAQILPLDEQFKFYHLLEYLDSLDKNVTRTDGGQYVMLRKVLRTGRANPPFYGIINVQHNRNELQSMWFRTIKVVEEIVTTRQALDAGANHQYVVPPRPSRDCTWSCDFFAMCSMMDDGSNWEGLLAEYYAHVDPHERYNAQDEGREITE